MTLPPPRLSVVVPAFNQESTIFSNVRTIATRLQTLGIDFEMIVVSDGSLDNTYDEAQRARDDRIRVLDYGRNMGKGYAVRTGAQEARGDMVAMIDSDLDLDPASLRGFVEQMESGNLDIVVGSKRHPDSDVEYPAKRRVYSWLYQQLVRAMFRLDVRDTQVGMKLFRRDVLADVLPVVLVKRYAFDLEMLAVARHFGHDRIEEAPIVLRYKFAGTGVNWRAIAHALWDTAAVFYRLRLLHYYDDARVLARRIAQHRRTEPPTLAVVVLADDIAEAAASIGTLRERVPPGTPIHVAAARGSADTPLPEGVTSTIQPDLSRGARAAAAMRASDAEVVAIIDATTTPSSRWASAALDLFGDPGVGAVVGPIVQRLTGDPLRDAAAILAESRIGVGGARIRHHVGQLREVGDHPADNMFVRREVLMPLLADRGGVDADICRRIVETTGRVVVCSPDVTTATTPSRPLFGPYLGHLARVGQRRGAAISAGVTPQARHVVPAALALGIAGSPLLRRAPGPVRRLAVAGGLAYGLVLGAFAVTLSVLHRRPRVVATAVSGAAASHVAFGAGVVAGVVRGVVGGRRSTGEGSD